MRVISGKARGLKLVTPQGLATRPTPDRVREALFSIIADRIPGARFLDLFAGTGANGIEALSRGAAHSTFVDISTKSIRIIQLNLERTGFADRADVHRLALPCGLANLETAAYDLVFLDPPYAFEDIKGLLQSVVEARLLSEQGIAVVEHAFRKTPPGEVETLSMFRQNRYGDTALSFFA
jgi:16S rRNA (guanine966-N2)-methyltransferase